MGTCKIIGSFLVPTNKVLWSAGSVANMDTEKLAVLLRASVCGAEDNAPRVATNFRQPRVGSRGL